MVVVRGKKEVAYVFFLYMFSKFFSYFTLLAFANYYLPEEYGQASFIFAIFHLVVLVTCLGMPDTLVPWLMKRKDTSSVFYFFVGVNAVVFVAALIGARLLGYGWVYPFIFLLPLMLLDYVARAVLKARYRYDISQWASTWYVGITLLLAVLLKSFGKSGIVWAYSIGYFVPILFLVWHARSGLRQIVVPFAFRLRAVVEYIRQGFPTALISTSFALLTWIDASILGFLAPFVSVAYYNVAGALANVVAAVPLSIMHFVLTRAAGLREEKKAIGVLHRGIRLSYVFAMLFGIAINAGVFLITKWFFPQYQGVELFVTILSVGVSFYAVYSLMASFLIGRMEQRKTVLPIVAAAVVNVVLDVVLVPSFGLYGITVATLCAHALALVLMMLRLQLYRYFWVLFLSPVLLFAAALLGMYGLLVVPAALFLFFLVGLLTKEDVLIVLQVVLRIVRRRA